MRLGFTWPQHRIFHAHKSSEQLQSNE